MPKTYVMIMISLVWTLTLFPRLAFADGLSDLLRNRDDIRVGERSLTAVPSKTDAYKYQSATEEQPFSALKRTNYRVEMEVKDGSIARLSEVEREPLANGKPGLVWMSTNRFEQGRLTTRTRCDGLHDIMFSGNGTKQSVNCVTVTPAFCARLSRVVKELAKKDMKDFSKDLRSCVDTVKNFADHTLIGANMMDQEYLDTVTAESEYLLEFQNRIAKGQTIWDNTSVKMFGEGNLEKGSTAGAAALKYFSAIHSGMEECATLEKFNPEAMRSAEQKDLSPNKPMLLRKVKGANGTH